MGILADHQIEKEVLIDPKPSGLKTEGVLSHGVGSYGLDLRCGDK